MYLGDFPLGQTLDFFFTTRRFSTGAPFTLAGTPVLSAYEDNSTTQITAGITLTVDFDSVTGLNHVRVVATGGNGFETGKSYALVITTGTVDSISVVGEVVGYFTIERSAAYSIVGSGTHGNAALKTLIDAVDDFIDTEVAAIKTKTDQLTFTTANRVDSQVFGMEAGVITAAAVATGAIDADALAADAVAEINAGLDAAGVRAAVGLAAANLDTQLVAIDDFLDTEITAIKTVTDQFVAAQAEPTGTPAAAATPLVKIAWVYMGLRNRVDVTASKKIFYDDGGAAEWEKDLSDNGTTYTESQANAP